MKYTLFIFFVVNFRSLLLMLCKRKLVFKYYSKPYRFNYSRIFLRIERNNVFNISSNRCVVDMIVFENSKCYYFVTLENIKNHFKSYTNSYFYVIKE